MAGRDSTFDVASLTAGTKYAFRARGGAAQADGSVDWGLWSVESEYATSGAAPRAAAPAPAPSAAPAGAAAAASGASGGGARAKKKAVRHGGDGGGGGSAAGGSAGGASGGRADDKAAAAAKVRPFSGMRGAAIVRTRSAASRHAGDSSLHRSPAAQPASRAPRPARGDSNPPPSSRAPSSPHPHPLPPPCTGQGGAGGGHAVRHGRSSS